MINTTDEELMLIDKLLIAVLLHRSNRHENKTKAIEPITSQKLSRLRDQIEALLDEVEA